MTDLDALKTELATLRSLDPYAALTRTTAELYLLIEEVERLRQERAAVVAFILAPGTSCSPDVVANAIERGEHRREEEP